MSTFYKTLRQLCIENVNKIYTEQEDTALPGMPPETTQGVELPPDTADQEKRGIYNALQVAAMGLLFDPTHVSEPDKATLSRLAEEPFSDFNYRTIEGILNSYLD